MNNFETINFAVDYFRQHQRLPMGESTSLALPEAHKAADGLQDMFDRTRRMDDKDGVDLDLRPGSVAVLTSDGMLDSRYSGNSWIGECDHLHLFGSGQDFHRTLIQAADKRLDGLLVDNHGEQTRMVAYHIDRYHWDRSTAQVWNLAP